MIATLHLKENRGKCPRVWQVRDGERVVRLFGATSPKYKTTWTFVLPDGDYEIVDRDVTEINVRDGSVRPGHSGQVPTYPTEQIVRRFWSVAERGALGCVPHYARALGVDVLTAARDRIRWIFDTFPRIYVSGPSGKDSGVVAHLVAEEARRRKRRVGLLFVDLEATLTATVDYAREMIQAYSDVFEPFWLAIPVNLRNATSMTNPSWIAWDPECRDDWVRQPDPMAITDPSVFPWYRDPWVENGRRVAMEFEDVVTQFSGWYGGGQAVACVLGVRAAESRNRLRTMIFDKNNLTGRSWTTWKGGDLFQVYPIYDWKDGDVWTYYGRTGAAYCRIYDTMWRAGIPVHHQRICQPYGDDQKRGLHMYHVLEPDTWARLVTRVQGASMGALYATERGNVTGAHYVELPAGHTWQSFAEFLLDTMPESEAVVFREQIATFLRKWEKKGIAMVDDDGGSVKRELGSPTWKCVVRAILRNDRAGKGMGRKAVPMRHGSFEVFER